MSISSMTNVAFSRRVDVETPEPVPTSNSSIVAAAGGTIQTQQGVGGALQVIMTYLPTEIVALYTSVSTAIDREGSASTAFSAHWLAFYICLLMTPATVWLMYAGRVRLADRPLPLSWRRWPIWEMTASTLAFAAWAYSMPGSPFKDLDCFYSQGVAAVVLPTTATFIALLAPILQKPLAG